MNKRILFQGQESSLSMPILYKTQMVNSMDHTKNVAAGDRRYADEEPEIGQLGLRLNPKSSLMENPQCHPVTPFPQRSQENGRPSKNLASYENLQVHQDFMNISKYNSRGGDFESREDKVTPSGGANAIEPDKRPSPEKKKPVEGRPPMHPSTNFNEDHEFRAALNLHPQRTLNEERSNSILPDGRVKEFKQAQEMDDLSANDPEQLQFNKVLIKDDKNDLKLDKPFKSLASNPMDSQNTDSINNRADDSQSYNTNNQYNQKMISRKDAKDGRRPQNLLNMYSENQNNANRNGRDPSNDSPEVKWEQTAKFGQTATSMSYSQSPGLASQQRLQSNNQAGLTPKSSQQLNSISRDNISQFQKQDRGNLEFCLTPAETPEEIAAKK